MDGAYYCHSCIRTLRPSVYLSVQASSLDCIICFFLNFWHGVRNPYEVVCGRAGFSGENLLPQNLGKWTKNKKMGQNKGFLNLLKDLVINFY